MTTICFDFDGVLASYDGWKDGAIGDPIPAGVELANLCRDAGYTIVVSTCRTHPEHKTTILQLRAIQKWMRDNNIPHDWIDLDGKPTADVYVDDRGLFFDQSMGKKTEGYGSYMMAVISQRVNKNE